MHGKEPWGRDELDSDWHLKVKFEANTLGWGELIRMWIGCGCGQGKEIRN